MSLFLLLNPDKVVEGVASNVNAAITQLPYEFSREDYAVINVTSQAAGANVAVEVLSGDFAAGNIGDVVYLAAEGYNMTGTILSVTNANVFHVDIAFNANASTTGHVNDLTTKANYAVYVKIVADDPVVTTVEDDTFIYTPAQHGGLFVDIGAVVVTVMENAERNSINYHIDYAEVYDQLATEPVYVTDAVIQALLSEKSTGLRGGSNLWDKLMKVRGLYRSVSVNESGVNAGWPEFILQEDSEGNSLSGIDVTSELTNGAYATIAGLGVYNGTWAIVAKRYAAPWTRFEIRDIPYSVNLSNGTVDTFKQGQFLTFFNRLKFWHGWRVGASFIIDSNWTTRNGSSGGQTDIFERALDINDIAVGPSVEYDVSITTPRINEHIINGNGLEPDTPALELRVINPSPGTPLLALQKVDREPECKNPIMVTWINSLGASEYYLFNMSQEVVLGATEGVVYETPVNQDIANVNRQTYRLSSDQTLRITCIAEQLTQADVRALHEIKTSEFVNVFLTRDGVERVGVVVREGFSTVYSTDEPFNQYTVVLEFPTDYYFFDVKRY